MCNGKIYHTLFLAVLLVIPIQTSLAENIFEGPVQEFYRPDGYIRDAIVADFNNDGLSDLVVTYSNTNSYEIFLSNGDGTLTSFGICTTSPVGWNIHCGDINEDGNVDLIYIYSTLYLLLGYGDGTFGVPIELPPYCWSGYSLLKDLNSDGHLDVVTGHGDSVCVFLGNGLGGFEKSWGYCANQSYFYYLSEIACDLDLDGAQDLICAYYIGGYCAIATFKGYGEGTFMDPVSYYPYPLNTAIEYVETGDFNDDSFPDIAGAGDAPLDQYAVAVFLNQQDGTFIPSDSGYYEIGGSVQHGLEVRDFDLNGHLDLSISGIGEIMPGYGNGYFSNDPDDLLFSYGLPYAGLVRAIDLDNDTDLDLIQAFEGFHHIKLYINTTINLGIEEYESGSMSNLILEVSPNPFSSSVTVSTSGFSSNPSDLQIFDLSGRLVTEIEPAYNGSEAVYHWNGRSASGTELPDGIYSAKLSSDDSNTGVALLKLE